MKDAQVIEALGGHHTVARALGMSPENALHFIKRGIPWRHRPAVKALARRKRVKLPPDFLEVQRGAI